MGPDDGRVLLLERTGQFELDVMMKSESASEV